MLLPSFPRGGLIATPVQSEPRVVLKSPLNSTLPCPQESFCTVQTGRSQIFSPSVPQRHTEASLRSSGGGSLGMTAAHTIGALIKVTRALMAPVIALGAAAPCQQQQWKMYGVYR